MCTSYGRPGSHFELRNFWRISADPITEDIISQHREPKYTNCEIQLRIQANFLRQDNRAHLNIEIALPDLEHVNWMCVAIRPRLKIPHA